MFSQEITDRWFSVAMLVVGIGTVVYIAKFIADVLVTVTVAM